MPAATNTIWFTQNGFGCIRWPSGVLNAICLNRSCSRTATLASMLSRTRMECNVKYLSNHFLPGCQPVDDFHSAVRPSRRRLVRYGENGHGEGNCDEQGLLESSRF